VIRTRKQKAGGWINETRTLGPITHEQTVALRDPTHRHRWSLSVGPLELAQGYPRGPVYINLVIGRLSADLRVRDGRTRIHL
jgi:hypothetical protein